MPNKNAVSPRMFELGETAEIRNLSEPDDYLNGKECIISSYAYVHKDGKLCINVIIDGDGSWALEPWNLKKLQIVPYDGYTVTKWKDCVWQPDPTFKKDDPFGNPNIGDTI